MKRLTIVLGMAAAFSASAFAADYTGYVVDKNCAANKAMWSNEACVAKCLKGGAKAVFVTEDGKVYAINEQDKVKDVGGKKVSITGKMTGDTISVDSVKAL